MTQFSSASRGAIQGATKLSGANGATGGLSGPLQKQVAASRIAPKPRKEDESLPPLQRR